jgi:hypothetical protein
VEAGPGGGSAGVRAWDIPLGFPSSIWIGTCASSPAGLWPGCWSEAAGLWPGCWSEAAEVGLPAGSLPWAEISSTCSREMLRAGMTSLCSMRCDHTGRKVKVIWADQLLPLQGKTAWPLPPLPWTQHVCQNISLHRHIHSDSKQKEI